MKMTNAKLRGASAAPPMPRRRPLSEADLRLEQLLAPFTPDRPGLAVLMTIGGETVFERYLGAADIEHGIPVTAATGFHIASASEQLTAFTALLEAEAGSAALALGVSTRRPGTSQNGEKSCFVDDDAIMIVLSNGQADIGAIEQALAEAYLGAHPTADITPDVAPLTALEGYFVWGGGPAAAGYRPRRCGGASGLPSLDLGQLGFVVREGGPAAARVHTSASAAQARARRSRRRLRAARQSAAA